MDGFTIAVVGMGCVVTTMLLGGFLREILRERRNRF